MKYSKQREMVLQAVRDNRVHPTAEFIYSYLKPMLPTISLATVYRNLNQLAEAGSITRLTLGDGVDHFDGNVTPHYHMICSSCRSVIDLPARVSVELDQEDALQRGYQVEGYEVAFLGICPSCSKKS